MLAAVGDVEGARRLLLGAAPLLLLIPVVALRPRGLLLHAAMAACLAASLVPPLLVYTDSGAHSISRVYEPRGRPCRRVGRGGGLRSVAAPYRARSPAARHASVRTSPSTSRGAELRAGSHVATRLRSLDALAAAWPEGTRVAVVDTEADVGGIPTLYFTVAFASRPPFRRVPIDTVWWPRLETLSRLDAWRDHEGPVTAVQVRDEAFVPAMPILPPSATGVAR
jgi:hypothetical protein